MNLLSSQDLIDAGYQPGLQINELLSKIAEYEARGINDPKYALKLLKRDVCPPPPKHVMRETPVALAEAILPVTKEERENVEAVRKQMHQHLKTPVIARGAILPDACPAGKVPAVIPVGGAIAVENAIIPSAHSADTCCSMLATFYDERSSVAKELDALVSSTRFGPEHRHVDDLVHDPVNDEDVWQNRFLSGLRDRARTQIADQGDGNHFAYLGEMEVNDAMLTILRLTGHGDLAGRFEKPGRYRSSSPITGRVVSAPTFTTAVRLLPGSMSPERLSTSLRLRRSSMRSLTRAATTGMPCNTSRDGRRRTIGRSTGAFSNASAAPRWRRSATSTTSSGSAATCSSTARAPPRHGRMPTADHRSG